MLGVQPTSPGFATFTVTPHPAGSTSARGVVPTPRGPIRVEWELDGGKLSLEVTAPSGTVWENAPAPKPLRRALGADDRIDRGAAGGVAA